MAQHVFVFLLVVCLLSLCARFGSLTRSRFGLPPHLAGPRAPHSIVC